MQPETHDIPELHTDHDTVSARPSEIAGQVLRWVLDDLCAPLGDPEHLGEDAYVKISGSHTALLTEVVWGRSLTPADDFYTTVPRFRAGAFAWPVTDYQGADCDDLVEVCCWRPDAFYADVVASHYVDWGSRDRLAQVAYDALRRAGLEAPLASVAARAIASDPATTGR